MNVPNGFDFSPHSAGGRERSDPRIELSKKLRAQAARHGFAPGSPKWRAYVLGTEAASRRRREAKLLRNTQRKNRPAYVTPGK